MAVHGDGNGRAARNPWDNQSRGGWNFYELHAEDDDWGQASTLVRAVMDDAARDRLVSNIVGALPAGVTEPVLQRASYLGNVDQNLVERVEKGVRDGQR